MVLVPCDYLLIIYIYMILGSVSLNALNYISHHLTRYILDHLIPEASSAAGLQVAAQACVTESG